MKKGLSLVIYRLLLIFLICSLTLNAQESPPSGPPPLTLDEAVSLAPPTNPKGKMAALTAATDPDKIAEARSNRLPSLSIYALGSELLTPVDFTFQKGVFGQFPGIGPVPPTDTKIH